MVLFPGQLQNTSWSLVFTAAGWYRHIYLTDVRLVLILSCLSKKMTFQNGFLWDFFHRFTENYIWACIDPWEGYDCVGRETLGGHQHLRERVWRAGPHGGALTLVSFTKGVSPPQRPTLNTRPLRPWGSQKTVPCQKLTGFRLIWIQRESKTRKVTLRENPVSAITCTPPPPTSNVSSHTPSRERCLYASSSDSGLSRSPVTCPAALPESYTWTSTGQ